MRAPEHQRRFHGFLEPVRAGRHSICVAAPALDRTGVFASVFCAIHCAVAPILLLSMPAFGGVWAHPLSHVGISAVVLPIAFLALRKGFRTHGKSWILGVGIVGIGLVAVGTALPYLGNGSVDASGACVDDCCPSFVLDEETNTKTLHIPSASVVTLLGGLSLIAAHFGNLRCCSRC